MKCRVTELRCKEVVNLCDGQRLGYPCDVMVNTASGQVTALVVPGPFSLWCLIGRGSRWVIPWGAIRRIGEDLILIEAQNLQPEPRR